MADWQHEVDVWVKEFKERHPELSDFVVACYLMEAGPDARRDRKIVDSVMKRRQPGGFLPPPTEEDEDWYDRKSAEHSRSKDKKAKASARKGR
jgi:hypothetical protein